MNKGRNRIEKRKSYSESCKPLEHQPLGPELAEQKLVMGSLLLELENVKHQKVLRLILPASELLPINFILKMDVLFTI